MESARIAKDKATGKGRRSASRLQAVSLTPKSIEFRAREKNAPKTKQREAIDAATVRLDDL
jgi:hypothetical protein